MALTSAIITYSLADLIGLTPDANNLRRWAVWADTNIPGDTVIDIAANQIRLGSGNGTIAADGTGSITLWIPGGEGVSNPASWQTTIQVKYPNRNAPGGRAIRTFGPFTIAASGDLADLVDEQEIPPEYVGAALAQMQEILDQATALLDAGLDATTATDGQVATADGLDGWAWETPAAGGVASVNGETGAVDLSAADVGAATDDHDHDAAYIAKGEVTVIDVITQAAYDALDPKIATTLYVIQG